MSQYRVRVRAVARDEDEPMPVQLPAIRVIRAATGKGLYDSKLIAEGWGAYNRWGEIQIECIVRDSGLGRLYALCWETCARQDARFDFEILSLERTRHGQIPIIIEE